MRRAERIAHQLHAIEVWLDRVFDGVIPGERGARVFWGSAMARSFAQPLWHLGRREQPLPSPMGRGFAAELASSVALLLWERHRDRRFMAHHGSGTPKHWLALIPGWPATNHAVLSELATGDYGLLLYGGFEAPGSRRASIEALLGLSPQRTLQLIRPEHDFAAALAAGIAASRRVWKRMQGPRPLDVGTGLLKLATIDVLRAVLADRRCRELYIAGKVFLPHASLCTHAAVDAALQRNGAETFEIVHGALAETETTLAEARSFSSVKVLRTRAEATLLPASPQRLLSGYVSEVPALPAARTPIERLLVLSNYATQPVHMPGLLPRLCHQDELFRCIAEADIDVTWRPHPYDDRAAVQATLAKHPRVRLSTGTLSEDIAQSDAVISSISSVLVDVALADRPVIVHAPDIHDPEDVPALLPHKFTTAAELLAFLRSPPSTTTLKRVLFGDEPPRLLRDLCR